MPDDLLTATGHNVVELLSELQSPCTSVHYSEAVQIHNSAEYSVLNAWNRLHEVKNLLVLDVNCFTICAGKNPTFMAIAIAMWAATHLAIE